VEGEQVSSAPEAARLTEIEALGLLAGEADIHRRLHQITSAYGTVRAILRTDGTSVGMDKRNNYLVEFDRSQDALAAAQALRCYLYGFSTLLVSVPLNGGNGTASLPLPP
jgi:hypothetical protein